MSEHVFAGLDGTERPGKPRTTGLTMVIDWGIGPHAQEDLLVTGAAYCDFAKVAVGISRVLPGEILRTKLARYQEDDVEPFPGGMYLEYAEMEQQAEVYLAAVARAGYRWLEVSDNVAPVSVEWKQRMIRRARETYELRVLGEVGKKEGLARATPLKHDAWACLEAGAEIILLEAAELVSEDPDLVREVEDVLEALGHERVMFELPGPWIEGVTTAGIHRMRRQLIDRYGPDVNLGNVDPDDLISLEAYRRGLGVNAGKTEGH